MKSKLLLNSAILLFLAIFFSQCSDPHERYEKPPWLGGTNIETLENDGNYTIFLKLMDLADYRTSIENQLFTLFVPSDSAFEAFFQKRGIGSVEDLSVQQAEEIFGLHILINPRSRDQLMYEYAWGELQDERGEYGTLFHKKETYSTPIDYTEINRFDPAFDIGEEIPIYRGHVMLPLWTTEYFEDYNGDPKGSDYLFMYPNSSWSGTQWHDAMVTKSEVRTSSGFIYFIDRVVEPPPTIEIYLRDHQDEFGLFYDIAQRFAVYNTPQFNELDVRRYLKSYSQILNFADAWGSRGGGVETRMLYMWTATIPSDAALQEFLDRTVFQYTDSIDKATDLFLVYLINSQLNNLLVLPSTMDSRYQNYFGDKIDVDIYTDIDETYMTCNGVIYKTNKFLEPNVFTCVPGPVFYNNDYSTFLYALELSELLTTLTKPDIDVTLFVPSNDKLEDYGIRQNIAGADVIIEIRASDNNWSEINDDDLERFVKDYIYYGRMEDFDDEGFVRMASDNYIYYNAGSVSGGGNEILGESCLVEEKVPSEKNGNLFYIDKAIKKPYNAGEFILNDPDLSSFGALLDEAGLIDSIQADYEQIGVEYPRVIFTSQLQQWTVLAPTNQAIADAELAGLIPHDLDNIADTLKNFLYYHFVRNKCVFDDGKFSGTVFTQRSDTQNSAGPIYQTLMFSNSVNDLSVQDKSGQIISIDHADANNLIEYGVLHKINKVLLKE